MSRIVVNNYMTHNIGRFRATAAVHDHGKEPCHCGGSCCAHKTVGRKLISRDSYSYADVAIDVRYVKGGYGRPKVYETRHYTVPNVLVDPRGYPPTPEFVRNELRKQPDHQEMHRNGWHPENITGYYKREQRKLGDVV